MKKTVFSLAFLAASGGYVAYANHGLDGVLRQTKTSDDTATAAIVAPVTKPSISPAVLDQAPHTSVAIAPVAQPATTT